jgi:hypothetical protein
MNITGVVLIAVIAFLLGAASIYFLLNERSRRLRERFGPEYSRTLEETGDRWKAESTLTRRAKRVEKLHIRQLALPERTRFANSWRDVQSRFVDDPQGTLAEADRLIARLMTAEGYPMSDFEHRVADRRILRLLQKWLKAGVSEDGQWSETKLGTPQGAVVSPLLANVYLHYVFDLWVEAWRPESRERRCDRRPLR